ncbi:DUF4082 domain-containing protein [Actinocrinis puniceicyclus]|uniref:DUF4082 domain-containing protein n=1 Tax=Actinocrinis puniceicyclus TaxID=977794 RepID=A0A8J7WRC8_9ACTN|nr:DUF4082 domain-containing protein [Actinocrinis puniceicyclus]MBS2966093.1 DUF4082 domain-containing protein [Actinocrinis puniceicyclus]
MAAAITALIAAVAGPAVVAEATDPCGSGSNPVVCENAQPGTPMSQWYSPSAWGDIQGFSTSESVQPGQTISFKVTSPASYTVQIYRLGWYGGDGARLMPTSPATLFPAVNQPNCTRDSSTGLTDCGNWSVTASWTVPSNAVSGVYLADLDQSDGKGFMPYPFVVADPNSHSDIVVQTSDQAWQAYNMYGGDDLYQGNGPAPDGRAYAVSYNRPLNVSGANGIFGSEYAMLQWLERNGYDVSYLSGIDVSTHGGLLLNHRTYLASGHDEYWNQSQWDAVTAARAAGVNLAFFSGNDVFWKTRLASSAVDGGSDRTVVTYKMTKLEFPQPDGIADPSGQWTGTWMDPNGAGIGGDMPQNQLTGTLFDANGYNAEAITVTYPYSTYRLWRNTQAASLQAGQTYTMQTGTLGYEWDSDVANAVRPSGEIDMSSTTVDLTNGTFLQDYGNTYANGTATHSLTEYRDPKSGALVFSSGTVQWAWGLSTVHYDLATHEDPVQEQATVNLLADMGAQPATLQSGLVQASQTTDTVGPAVSVATPASGSTVPAMSPVTVSGTAADSGGGVVARVEVSVDNGATWQPAAGLGNWSFSWTPTRTGALTLLVRAEDDSDNVGTAASIPLTVGPQSCPCSIFPNSATPAKPDSGDASPVNLGVKFATSTSGAVTGVRFYKSVNNTGTHVGSLWTSNGTLLGSVTFGGETASGWQTALFSQPIPVSPNTTYVVSYLAPSGHYSADAGYFADQGAGLAPITALQSNSTSLNGVYKYAGGTVFPANGYNNTNYYVDAVFQANVTSTTPPAVTSTQPAGDAAAVPVNSPITASLSEGISASTLKFTVKDQNGNAQSGAVRYDPVGHVATFTPNGQLAMSTTYTGSVSATDLWGNAMPSPYTWSFTTASTPPSFSCPCSLWNAAATPANQNTSDGHSVELGVRFQSAVSGYVTGVSFFKGVKNTGTHTGSLWTTSGALLATGTFTNESASGWQTLTFATPVAINANTPYIASYHAPIGYYSSNGAYFTSAITSYPLTALQSVSGAGNGLYLYESGSTLPPANTYNATNYWVDVSFTTTPPSGSSGGSSTAAATSKGAVSPAVDPLADNDEAVTATTGVSDAVHPPTVTFAQPIAPQSLRIRVVTTVGTQGTESAAGTPVAGTLLYNPATQTASFRPDAPLRPGAVYRAVATANGLNGKAIAAVGWTFREAVAGSSAPAHLPKSPPNGQGPMVVALSTEGDSWRRVGPPPPTDL